MLELSTPLYFAQVSGSFKVSERNVTQITLQASVCVVRAKWRYLNFDRNPGRIESRNCYWNSARFLANRSFPSYIKSRHLVDSCFNFIFPNFFKTNFIKSCPVRNNRSVVIERRFKLFIWKILCVPRIVTRVSKSTHFGSTFFERRIFSEVFFRRTVEASWNDFEDRRSLLDRRLDRREEQVFTLWKCEYRGDKRYSTEENVGRPRRV